MKWEAALNDPLSVWSDEYGHRVLSAEVTVDEEGEFGTGGKVTLRMGETVIGEGRFEKLVPFRFTVNETFDVGCDTVTPVSDL